jgi:hypothetical protein
MVFIIGSVSCSNLCVDSPDPKLINFLDENSDSFGNSIVFKFARFYIGGCRDAVPMEMQDTVDAIVRVFGSIVEVAVDLRDNAIDIEVICGSDSGLITSFAEAVQLQVCTLAITLFDIQAFFSCDNWHPLYAVVVHDAICYEGTDGFHYIAITQFVIVFLAMVMVTLRVAFKELQDEEDAEADRRWWSKWVACCCVCDKDKGINNQIPKEEDKVDCALDSEAKPEAMNEFVGSNALSKAESSMEA